MKNNIKALVVLAVVVAAVVSGTQFQLFQTSNPNFILDTNGIGSVNGYTVSLLTHDTYAGACKANTCGGTQTSTDANGCPIYTAPPTQAQYICDSGTCCGSYSYQGQSYCGTFSQGQACGGVNAQGGTCAGSVGCQGSSNMCSYHAGGSSTCGGYTAGIGCGMTLTVSNSSGTLYDTGAAWKQTIGQLDFQGLSVTAPVSNTFNMGSCTNQLVRVTPLIPSDSFDLSITPEKSSYFQRENATIDIAITSTYAGSLTANITTTVCAPTFAGQFCNDYTTQKTITSGVNTLTYSIPTATITASMTVQTTAKIFFSAASAQGLKIDCGSGLTAASNCAGKIVIAQVSSPQTTVMVIPRPLVVSPPCPDGYTLKNSQCLSNDVLNLNLNCLVLGCPNVAGALYSCTSSGVCAETITQYVNVTNYVNQTVNVDCQTTGCPVGMTCLAAGSINYCLRSEFVNVITQCTAASDCVVPCSGISVNCNAGVCDYSGSCTATTVGCRELGCSDGYACNAERNVCEKTVTNTITNTITNTVTQVPLWVYGAIFALVMALVIVLFVRKNK